MQRDGGVLYPYSGGHLEKAKSWPCVFNNWAVFYRGKFVTVNLLDTTALKRLLKKQGVPMEIRKNEMDKWCTCKERWGAEFEIAFVGCPGIKQMYRQHQVRSRKVRGANL